MTGDRRIRNAWPVLFGAIVLIALVTLGFVLNIVRIEGWEGVWKRKKVFIERTHPEAKPVMDEAEKRF